MGDTRMLQKIGRKCSGRVARQAMMFSQEQEVPV
jgi:hypothetical protein